MKAKKPSKAPVHIMLEAPIQLRKEILSTAIDATRLLKEYEEFLALKNKKMKTLKFLQKEMREIKKHAKEFINQEHFPVVPHHEPVQRAVEEAPVVVPKTKHAAKQEKPVIIRTPKKPVTEMDKLNQELSDIEAKLGKL